MIEQVNMGETVQRDAGFLLGKLRGEITPA